MKIYYIGDNEVAGPNRVYLQRLSILESNQKQRLGLLVELNARLSKYISFLGFMVLQGKGSYYLYLESIIRVVRKKVKENLDR